MNRSSVWIVFIIVLAGSIPAAGLILTSSADFVEADLSDTGSPGSRKAVDNITRFSNGRSSSELTFGSSGGTSTDLNISVKKRSTVLNADVDLMGIQSLPSGTFDFTDTVNHSAWHGDTAKLPKNEHPKTFEQSLFTNQEYNSIKTNDSIMAEHSSAGITKNKTHLFHLFKFKVTVTAPAKFEFFWYGASFRSNAIFTTNNEVYGYIYCPGNKTWIQFDHQAYLTGFVRTMWIDRDVSTASNYLNTTNSAVYIMVIGPEIDLTTIGSDKMSTDFVNLTAFGGNTKFPSGVRLGIGSGNIEVWKATGDLTGSKTVGDGEGFKTKLQQVIDAAGTEEEDFYVTFNISTEGPGRLWVGNLHIRLEVLEHNEPPQIMPGTLVHFYMTEDDAASGDNLINLEHVFTDDHDSTAELRYGVYYQDDEGNLTAKLDADGHHIDFTPASNFYGTVKFRVNATDSGADEIPGTFDDLVRTSNMFNVTVRPVNDRPALAVEKAQLSVKEHDRLKFNVSASDIDDTEFTWNTIFLEWGLSLYPDGADSSKAVVEIVPKEDHLGETINFTLSVTDKGGGQGDNFKRSGILNLSVNFINVNDPPVLVDMTLPFDGYSEPLIPGIPTKLINSLAAEEDSVYEIQVEADDPDMGIDPDETLAYSIEPMEPLAGKLDIDAGTGLITLEPANGDVGTVEFTVKVMDLAGESALHDFEVQVNNINDPPRDIKIVLPTERKFTEEDSIKFKGECYDDDLDLPDSGETLSFLWLTNRTVKPLGAGPELSNITLEPGVHNITLRVSDESGLTIQTSIFIEVTSLSFGGDPGGGGGGDKNNDGGNDSKDGGGPDGQKTDNKSDEKSSAGLYAGIAGLMIFIVIIIIFLFSFFRSKKNKEDAEDGAGQVDAAQQPAQPEQPAGPMPFPVPAQNLPEYTQQQYQQYQQPLDPPFQQTPISPAAVPVQPQEPSLPAAVEHLAPEQTQKPDSENDPEQP